VALGLFGCDRASFGLRANSVAGRIRSWLAARLNCRHLHETKKIHRADSALVLIGRSGVEPVQAAACSRVISGVCRSFSPGTNRTPGIAPARHFRPRSTCHAVRQADRCCRFHGLLIDVSGPLAHPAEALCPDWPEAPRRASLQRHEPAQDCRPASTKRGKRVPRPVWISACGRRGVVVGEHVFEQGQFLVALPRAWTSACRPAAARTVGEGSLATTPQ